jgi:hypothetical protein
VWLEMIIRWLDPIIIYLDLCYVIGFQQCDSLLSLLYNSYIIFFKELNSFHCKEKQSVVLYSGSDRVANSQTWLTVA